MSRRGAAWGAAHGLLLVLLAAPVIASTPVTSTPPTAPVALGAATATVGRVDGIAMIAGNDLARVLGASKSWRSDVRKLVLQMGTHRLAFTVDNPFVLADDRTLQLAHSIVMRSGEVQVPLDLLVHLPQGQGWPRLMHDPAARLVWAAPERSIVGLPEVTRRDDRTVLTLSTRAAEEARVLARGRSRFRLRLPGVFAGTLPDSLPDGGLVHDVAVRAVPGGIVFEFAVAPEAKGWRLERVAAEDRVRLVFAVRGDSLSAFASERDRAAQPLRTVVLDPGHGGAEAGVRVEGTVEKDLTLELARRLALALQRRGVAQVLLTRSDDIERPQPERAELANRARADAVIALHFETWSDARAEGAVVWCAPGTGLGDVEPLAPGMVAVRPWRDAGLDRASESRQLADAVAAALDRHGDGPAHVRERMPFPLLGVQAPGVMIACGNLARVEQRARLTAPGGLDALADAIAEGVVAWSRD